jgi:gamma-glutamyltranspeptidase/glutathione hydrolase
MENSRLARARSAILCGFITLAASLTCSAADGYWGTETTEARDLTVQYAAKRGTMGTAPHAMVAACHKRSVDIGLAILKQGGSAADAFIAATFADYVQAPGTSSLGGPVGMLAYDSRSGKVDSLTAPMRTVGDPDGQWATGEHALGKQVLIPGSVAGLALLHRRHGKLAWAKLIAPARALAADGFDLDPLYAAILSNYKSVAAHGEYGRATFFHADGTPLGIGEHLKLPRVAQTLDAIAKDGADYFYRGEWAAHAVREINAEGGKFTAVDLGDYRASARSALQTTYRGQRIFALNTPNSGGLRLLLALRTLENTDVAKAGHYSESLSGLELMLRTVSAVNAEPQLYSHDFMSTESSVRSLLDGQRATQLWQTVKAATNVESIAPHGSHSYSVVVVDAAGNTVAGTHTIESLPFGSGIFVDGVPLNNAGIFHSWQVDSPYSTPPGNDVVEPLSAVIAFRGKQMVLATATFSNGLWPADLQTVVSALDFGWTPERIALTPRFGGYSVDLSTMVADPTTTSIDKRFNPDVVTKLAARGIKLSQQGYIDTGMIVVVARNPHSGLLTGFTPEQLPEGKAAGY